MNNAQYIKEVRKRLPNKNDGSIGLSQSEMADKISMTQKTISGWETGRNDIPLITLLVYERFANDEGINIEKPEQLQ